MEKVTDHRTVYAANGPAVVLKKPLYGWIPPFDNSQNGPDLLHQRLGDPVEQLGSFDHTLLNGHPAGHVHNGLHRRAVESSLSVCETLCDRYPDCIGLNFYGTNCTLFSRITGQVSFPGAIAVAVSRPVQSTTTQTSVEQTSTLPTTTSQTSIETLSSSEAGTTIGSESGSLSSTGSLLETTPTSTPTETQGSQTSTDSFEATSSVRALEKILFNLS